MTDDLVARLRHEQELCAIMGDAKAGALVSEAADRLEAAEARVRELEAELADQQAIAKYNREQAEKAERQLAEAYERAAKVAELSMASKNLADRSPAHIAAAIRGLPK